MARRTRPTPRLVVEDVRVPMRDGTLLAADVTRVDDGAPRKVLLVRTPYSRAAGRAMTDPVAVARDGWVVVNVDCRGRFDSEGVFDVFHQEPADGADTIAWCAQQPWSDGRVVMHGPSYVGATQMLAAGARPEALRAISPVVTSDQYRDSWCYEGGAFQLLFAKTWALQLAMGDPNATARQRKRALDLAGAPEKLLRLPHKDSVVGELFPAYRRWLDPDDADYWRPIEVRRRHARMDVPAIHVAGWYDIFAEGSLRNYTSLAAAARAPQRLIIGPWTHGTVFLTATAEHDFGFEASGLIDNTPGKILDWLAAAAAGEEVAEGVRAFVMGRGEWVELKSWPPPSTPTTLWLGDGVLAATPPAEAGHDRYLYDPENPVPTRGGRTLGPHFPTAGPVDQRPVEDRDDVLVYTSEPLDHDLTVMGMVTADIRFASDAVSADVTVKLVDVHPDGRALNVVDGIRRTSFTPGRAKTVRVDVGSTAMTFLRGHRIRVEVSSSNFPRFDRNSSTGVPLFEVDHWEPAVQTVHRGGRAASRLTLPVV